MTKGKEGIQSVIWDLTERLNMTDKHLDMLSTERDILLAQIDAAYIDLEKFNSNSKTK